MNRRKRSCVRATAFRGRTKGLSSAGRALSALLRIKSQQLDLTHFEDNMKAFKDAFGRNYRIASDKLNDAVAGIDRTISSLQTIRKNLLSSDHNLRLANDKAENLSIKGLTKGAPTVAAMLAEVREATPGKRTEEPLSEEEE